MATTTTTVPNFDTTSGAYAYNLNLYSDVVPEWAGVRAAGYGGGEHLIDVDAPRGGWSPYGGTVNGEHGNTTRAKALRAAKALHGDHAKIIALVDISYFRRDGVTMRSKTYSVSV